MYHCTPSQLDRETGKYMFEMLQDMKCRGALARAEQARLKLSSK